jgi:hypothetical protein
MRTSAGPNGGQLRGRAEGAVAVSTEAYCRSKLRRGREESEEEERRKRGCGEVFTWPFDLGPCSCHSFLGFPAPPITAT